MGGSSDLSSVYYNPGRLALVNEPELLLAGNVFEYSTIKLKERGQDISSSRFSLTPSLFAGEFRFGWLGKSRLAYSFLTRSSSEFNTQGRLQNTTPAFPERPDLEFLADSVRVDQKLSEYWGGVTWATTVGNGIGVGVSTFGALRNQRRLVQRTILGDFGGIPATSQATAEYRYDHWRALWKLGVGTNLYNWDVGLPVTTPGLKLFGSGDVAGDRSIAGVPNDLGYRAFVDHRGIASTYKSPWAVGIGGARRFDKTHVHLGVEWFDFLALCDVLPADLVTPVIGDGLVDLTVRQESDSVINIAAGVAHTFNGKWEGYASIRTDFSTVGDGTESNLSFTEWNLYHLSVGATVHTDAADFTAGLILAFGSSNAPPRIEQAEVQSSYFRVTAILGFSFGFAEVPSTQ